MSKIKLRAWDRQNKKMIGPLSGILWGKALIPTDYVQGLFERTPDNYSSIDFFDGEMMAVGDCELMEYIDLKDKSGKEICEGDILQETFLDKVLEWSLWQVIREQGAFGVRPLPSAEEDPRFRAFHGEEAFQLDRYSIIGNIYENPELLEKPK